METDSTTSLLMYLPMWILTFAYKMCGPHGGCTYAKSEFIGTEAENWIEGNDYVEPVIVGGGNVRIPMNPIILRKGRGI